MGVNRRGYKADVSYEFKKGADSQWQRREVRPGSRWLTLTTEVIPIESSSPRADRDNFTRNTARWEWT